MLLLKLAFRNIFRQRRRSLLTGLSMTGGYLLCALSISILDGTYGGVIDLFTKDHTGHIQIHKGNYLHRPKIYLTIEDREKLEAIVASQETVEGYAPRVYAPALAYGNDKSSPVQVVGVDTVQEKTSSQLANKVKQGAFFGAQPDNNGHYPAMIGVGVSVSLKLKIGDEIVLISQGADGSIANDIYIVSAIVGTKDSYERNNVYLPLPVAQEFLTLGQRVHEYAVLLGNIDKTLSTTEDLKKDLDDPELTISPWQEVESGFYNALKAEKEANKFMLGVIVFIVFIGVLNTVVMSVLERTREFGVLRAIGTNPLRIASMIVLETSILGLMSCLIGLLLALPLIYWFTYVGIELAQAFDIGGIKMSHMKGSMTLNAFTTPALVILGSALLVSLPPGLRAARITPVDALSSH